jgi:vancomycin resistance protein YoaR
VPGKPYTVYRLRRRRRTLRIAVLAALLVLGGLLGSAAWLARGEAGRLPPSVEIGGVDVGGLTVAEARALLEQDAERRAAQPILLVYESGRIETSGAALGAEAQIDEALEQAVDSRGRFSRLKARLGLGDAITLPLSFETSPKTLEQVLDRVEREVERKVVPANVELVGGEIVVTRAESGIQLDRTEAARRLVLLPPEVALTLRTIDPRVSDADAEAAGETAEELLHSPPAVVFRTTRLELGKKIVREGLRFARRDGAIEVSLDPTVLEQRLHRAFREYERSPRDASFLIEGASARLVPARRGREVAPKRMAEAIVAAAGLPEVPAVFDTLTPELTTAEGKQLRIRELVSEFMTAYPCCAPRVTNIQLAAKILDGQIIEPGARFSLNEALGERTEERGFVPAPMIEAGRLKDAVGGGVSQVATTMYNAAFFAGVELIEHTPHEFYISRYPMGREATVSWGGPELIFRNDWKAGILIKAQALDTSITIRFYSSTLGRRVETQTGEPYAYEGAGTVRIFDPSLPPGTETVVQGGGISGFTVEYTRDVYRGKRLIKDESYRVRYKPENTIVEYGPEPEPPAEPPPAEEPPSEEPPAEEAPAEEPPAEPPPDEPPPDEPPPPS